MSSGGPLRFLMASENVLFGASVATSAGTTDPEYDDDDLCDGSTSPVRSVGGTVRWTATGLAAGQVGVVIPHSHTIDPARTITIGGGVSGTGAGPAARTNGVAVNPWIPITVPATTALVSIEVSGNSKDVVIGELLAGRLRELASEAAPGWLRDEFDWGYLDIGAVRRQNPGGSVRNYDRGLVARWCRGAVIVDATERDLLEAWWESSRNDVRPSALLPFRDRNDAWVGRLASMAFSSHLGWYKVVIEFHEWARKRWIG